MINKLKYVYIGSALIILTAFIGVFGYVHIEHASILDSVYMTVITITTVGFGEVFPLSDNGKIFTIFMILMGTGTVAYTATQFIDYVVTGDLTNMFGRRKMQHTIDSMNNHFILCGFGRMGRIIAEILRDNQVPFIIVDPEERKSEAADEKYVFVTGDATHDMVLKRAGVDRAKGLITVVDTDEKNLYIVLTAKGLNKKLYIVAKVAQEEANSKFMWAGADKIVSPYTIGGRSIAYSIIKPHVSDFLDMTMGKNDLGMKVEEVIIHEGNRLENVAIMDSNVRQLGIIIVAIRKNDGVFLYNPGPHEVIRAEDTLIALGRSEDFIALDKYLSRG
ncbi:MAG: TrkA family potassium uptake protein [Deferribacterales bacterium]